MKTCFDFCPNLNPQGLESLVLSEPADGPLFQLIALDDDKVSSSRDRAEWLALHRCKRRRIDTAISACCLFRIRPCFEVPGDVVSGTVRYRKQKRNFPSGSVTYRSGIRDIGPCMIVCQRPRKVANWPCSRFFGCDYEKARIFCSRLPDQLWVTFCGAWMALHLCNHDVISSDTCLSADICCS